MQVGSQHKVLELRLATAALGQRRCPCLLRGAVVRVQNGLIRDIIGASAEVGTGSKVNQLEALLPFSKDDVLQSEWTVRLLCHMQGQLCHMGVCHALSTSKHDK